MVQLRRFLLLGCVALLMCAFTPFSYADSLPQALKYVENWEFGGNWDEDEGPSYFADLIFPLWEPESADRVFFFEPRSSFSNKEFLFNLGTGYRQLVKDGEWMLGFNTFYDYETEYSHYRIGWGVEALSSYAELRSNYYLGLSQERLVEETVGAVIVEGAIDGYDFEIGAPVPHYSRLKLFGGFNWYNLKKIEINRYGWTLRAEYKPVKYVVIDGLLSNDTKTNVDWGMTVALRIPFGGENSDISLRSPFEFDDTMFPESDASEFLGVLVERHHEIVVEKVNQTTTVNIEVRRGT